jgi:hypothetical protein
MAPFEEINARMGGFDADDERVKLPCGLHESRLGSVEMFSQYAKGYHSPTKLDTLSFGQTSTFEEIDQKGGATLKSKLRYDDQLNQDGELSRSSSEARSYPERIFVYSCKSSSFFVLFTIFLLSFLSKTNIRVLDLRVFVISF